MKFQFYPGNYQLEMNREAAVITDHGVIMNCQHDVTFKKANRILSCEQRKAPAATEEYQCHCSEESHQSAVHDSGHAGANWVLCLVQVEGQATLMISRFIYFPILPDEKFSWFI